MERWTLGRVCVCVCVCVCACVRFRYPLEARVGLLLSMLVLGHRLSYLPEAVSEATDVPSQPERPPYLPRDAAIRKKIAHLPKLSTSTVGLR